MIWDEFPEEFSADDLASAADVALGLESDSGMLTQLADRLKAAGEQSGPAGATSGRLLIADALVCDLWLARGTGLDRWGALGPMMEMPQGLYPPPVQTFPDSLRPYLEARAAGTVRADLRARYHHFLWLRWHSIDDARAAHEAYLEAGRGHASDDDATSSTTAMEYLAQAADLSIRLGIKQPETILTLRDEILEALPRDGAGFAALLLERSARLLVKEREAAKEILDTVIHEASVGAPGRRHRERSLLAAGEALTREMGDTARATQLRIRQAQSYKLEAAERAPEGPLVELALLNDAARIFGSANAGAEVQLLKPALEDAGRRAVGELKVMSGETSVPADSFEKAAQQIVDRLGEDEGLLLGAGDMLGLWPDVEDLEARFDQATKDFPLQHLFGHLTLMGDGRFEPDPDDPQRRREAQLTRFFSLETTVRVAFGRDVISILEKQGRWSNVKVLDALGLASPELADSCRPALEAVAQGSAWVGAHALVPQLERALHVLAAVAGVSVMRTAPRGGLRWASLDEILDDEEMEAALGMRLAMALRRIFVDPYGPNYRNELAHGAADPTTDLSGVCMLSTLAILSVASRILAVRADMETGDSDASASPGP